MSDFERIFRAAQEALGLHHYHVEFEALDLGTEVADIAPDPVRCFAYCRYHPEALEKAGRTASVAVHEACHLLLADLVHACGMGERAAAIEEERTVMRLEAIVRLAIGETLTPPDAHGPSPLGFPCSPHPHGGGGDGDELCDDHL